MEPDSVRQGRRKTITIYVVASALVALALWAELRMAHVASAELRWLPFSLSVGLSAWLGGLGPGVLAIVLAVLASDYFLLAPGVWLRVDTPDQWHALAGLAVAWLVICLAVESTFRGRQRDREARADAERGAAHADRLAQLAGALGRARTSASVMEVSLQESLHSLHADAAMLLLVNEDHSAALIARMVAYGSGVLQRTAEIRLDVSSPVSDVVQRRALVVLESGDAWRAEYPDVPDHVRLAEYEATFVVPLLVGSRVAAVIRLDCRAARTLTPCDHEYLSVLGTNAGQALDRAWQFESAQRARADAEALRAQADQELAERQKTESALRASETRHRALATRTARMHDLTAALSEAVTTDAVARAVVRHGSLLVGAAAASVSVLAENGAELETLYAEGHGAPLSSPCRSAVEDGACTTAVIRTGCPVWVHSWTEWHERYWRSASLAADAAYLSSAVLPLLVDGRPRGVVEFHFTVPVKFDAEYEALLVSVAQHCAQALDRAHLYESAQSARKEAEAANRLKDDFLSIVSHELRTPLNAVVGWASMLRDRTLSPDITARAVQAIYDNAMRQAKLIDDLLDVSRMAAGTPTLDVQEMELDPLLAGVVESMMPAATVSSIVVTVRPIPAIVIRGDRRRLEQVFFNLLGNALKFTPSGGQITVAATCADRMVEVRVSDTGIGIEPEFLPHVFDRFRQHDSTRTRTHGGLGLGLAIAKQLVEAHGGTITVESAGKNGGSTFSVSLPVATCLPDEALLPVEPQPLAGASGVSRLDGVRVLVVDDESDAREVMTHALQLHGARVAAVASAAEALQILNGTEIDVLLADIAMPGEDGYSLMRRVRASHDARIAAVPAAAVTAHARYVEREQAFAAGFQCHLSKPVDPVQLVRAVKQMARPGPEAT